MYADRVEREPHGCQLRSAGTPVCVVLAPSTGHPLQRLYQQRGDVLRQRIAGQIRQGGRFDLGAPPAPDSPESFIARQRGQLAGNTIRLGQGDSRHTSRRQNSCASSRAAGGSSRRVSGATAGDALLRCESFRARGTFARVARVDFASTMCGKPQLS
jgi:hypothetical protein